MKKRLLLGTGVVLLAISVLLVAWQGSFNMGRIGPSNPDQTFIFGAIFLLIFILMVTLGFILFRELARLYIARHANQPGSRIRTRLVMGALALSCVPVFCLVLFSFEVLSHSVDRWFTNPVDREVDIFVQAATLLEREMQDETNAQTALLAAKPEVHQFLERRLAAAALPGKFRPRPGGAVRGRLSHQRFGAARVLDGARRRPPLRPAAARAFPRDGRHAHPGLRGTGRARAPRRGAPGLAHRPL